MISNGVGNPGGLTQEIIPANEYSIIIIEKDINIHIKNSKTFAATLPPFKWQRVDESNARVSPRPGFQDQLPP